MKIIEQGDNLIINLTHERKLAPAQVEAFEADLQQAVPHLLRDFNRLNGEWTVAQTFRNVLEDLQAKHLNTEEKYSLF